MSQASHAKQIPRFDIRSELTSRCAKGGKWALSVVQWATGKVGRRALAAIIKHPELELVGVYVHSLDKVGVDAGQLAGMADTGVRATNEVDLLLAERPDCVSFMAAELDVEIVEVLLRNGANVVTTSNGYLTGTNFGRGMRERLDTVARDGGATFMGTGFDPGFVNLLAGMLTGACRRVHSVKLVETLDCAGYPDPDVWRSLGFGQPVRARRLGPLSIVHEGALLPLAPDLPGFFDTLDLVAGMLAVELDHKEAYIECAAALTDVDLGWMHIPTGTMAAVTRTYLGYAHGRSIVELRVQWTMSRSLDCEWIDPEGYWIEIEGEPRVEAAISFRPPMAPGVSDEPDVMSVLLVGTAMAAVNAVPFVCEAAPGHTTPANLPVFGARHMIVSDDSGTW
jgi:2,4-diaminopentanoate dehydrogenase